MEITKTVRIHVKRDDLIALLRKAGMKLDVDDKDIDVYVESRNGLRPDIENDQPIVVAWQEKV